MWILCRNHMHTVGLDRVWTGVLSLILKRQDQFEIENSMLYLSIVFLLSCFLVLG
jgi:hypothetical protein